MTTPSGGGSTIIGRAVLQIIPSLRNVTEEIEKQLPDKPIDVAVAPTVDKRATERAGKDAGDILVKETKDAVRKGDIGKSVADSVKDSVSRSGGIRDAAVGAATEFGRGLRDGITSELRTAGIGNILEGINSQVLNTTSLIQGIGGATGIDVSPIVDATNTISGAVDRVSDSASTARNQVSGVLGPLQQFGEMAGPESKLYKAAGRLPLLGSILEMLPAMREGNAQLEGMVQKYTGLNVPLSGESWLRWLTDNGNKLNSATDNVTRMHDEALRQAQAAGPPPGGGRGIVAGRAAGGMVPGFSTKDNMLGLVNGRGLIGLAGGEGIINATTTRRLGGAPFISWLNGFADGGIVPPDVSAAESLAGTGYSQGARTDCSGMVARTILKTLGRDSSGGLMSTKNAASWLKNLGFQPGIGGPGQISVGWYDHGPNPNDGHMAMTLSDGRNAESGGSVGAFTIGGKAKGASSPQFDQHMHLPTVYGEGPAGSSSAAPVAASSGSAASSAAASVTSSSSGSSGGGFKLPSSISGLASWGLGDLKGPETGPGKRQFEYGKAVEAAVSGQVDSALGVLGIPEPHWLSTISNYLGSISIGGSGFGGAAPGSAAPIPHMGSGAAPGPGGITKQLQGPGVVYNITARDTEDAFIRANRKEKERAATKLSRF